MKLPDSFTRSMKELFGTGYDDFIASFDSKSVSALRVNTSKISLREFEAKTPYPLEKIPFVSDGYYINDTDAWSKHPYYFAGLFYLQEPSAMLAAEIMPVREGDMVLDLCAAPGGKSTKLATKEPGLLVSNDISFSRTIPLVKNLEHFGCGNYFVTASDPEKLALAYGQYFDGILVDAPCSGEGMFRRDSSLMRTYDAESNVFYSRIQSEILDSAYKMLKAGGYLLYSTCTFSDIENEQVVLKFLNDHKDMSAVSIDDKYCLCPAYDTYKDLRVYHFFPHKAQGEGHFIALMKKEGKNQGSTLSQGTDACGKLPEACNDFLRHLSEKGTDSLNGKSFITGDDGYIYMLPEASSGCIKPHIRYVRTGTVVGRIKNGRFVPHTAFALCLHADDFDNILSFHADDPDVTRYLKGETVVMDEKKSGVQKGWVLICVDRFPLGFAKYDGKKIKNLYEKGWVMT